MDILIKRINLSCNRDSKIYKAFIIILGSLSIALAAQITIPLLPVSVTLQTFAILLISAIFGPITGTQMVVLYLLEGIAGFPVFTGFRSGFAIICGPTGGYLIGFAIATCLTGHLLKNGWAQNKLKIFIALLLGDITLFVTGYLLLAYLIGYRNAYIFGVAPFYLIEIAKLLLLTPVISLLVVRK